MAFPDAPRVLYDLNPLDEVISRFRFPAVLRIDAEPPAAFQDHLRGEYPRYRVRPSVQPPTGLPDEVATLFAREVAAGGQTHEFASADELWTVSLTRNSLSLTCGRYERWEVFSGRLQLPLRALGEVYRPNPFERVVLRYRDLIRRSRLGLQEVPWAELLRPWLVGPLADPAIADAVEHTVHEMLVHLPDDLGHLDARYGIVSADDPPELCYGIDAAFLCEQPLELADALARLDAFNAQARLFFRWCIQDRLHQAMRPQPLLAP
jgi:uncharacterized protein (TIGR04255 family)